jgi:hypothetical protein
VDFELFSGQGSRGKPNRSVAQSSTTERRSGGLVASARLSSGGWFLGAYFSTPEEPRYM